LRSYGFFPTWMKASSLISRCELWESPTRCHIRISDCAERWAVIEELFRRQSCCAASKSSDLGVLTPPCIYGQRRSRPKPAFAGPEAVFREIGEGSPFSSNPSFLSLHSVGLSCMVRVYVLMPGRKRVGIPHRLPILRLNRKSRVGDSN
jgi:hypothetical protein